MSVEVIAGIFAAIGIIKILVILINKGKWHKHVVKPIYSSNAGRNSVIVLILSFGILYYLLKELTIVQIFAVIGFFSFFIMFVFLQYQKELKSLIEKAYKKEFNSLMWVYIIIWTALSLWVLYLLL